MNVLERLIAKKATLDLVLPGDQVEIQPDALYITSGMANQFLSALEKKENRKSFRLERTIVSIDGNEETERLCKKYGTFPLNGPLTEKVLYEVTGEEEGFVVTTHRNIYGLTESGFIPLHVSPLTMSQILISGTYELTVPETVYIDLIGTSKLVTDVQSLNLYLYDFFRDSLIGHGVILGGELVKQMTKEKRKQLANFFVLAKVSLGMISPSGPYGQVESVVKLNITERQMERM